MLYIVDIINRRIVKKVRSRSQAKVVIHQHSSPHKDNFKVIELFKVGKVFGSDKYGVFSW